MLKASNGALRRNATHCPERRKRRARKACAMFSGSTNWFKRVGVTVGLEDTE